MEVKSCTYQPGLWDPALSGNGIIVWLNSLRGKSFYYYYHTVSNTTNDSLHYDNDNGVLYVQYT